MTRQKGFDIFIKPYTIYVDNSDNSNRLIHKGDVFIRTPGSTSGSAYSALQGGECYMLYKSNIKSFKEAQKEVKNLMDTLGYTRDAIKLVGDIPLDYILTPSK